MTLNEIYSGFKKLELAADKVDYLKKIQSLGMLHKINYDVLIEAWKNSEPVENKT